ncbi:Aldehyde dehydrogenase family 3 member B1 [Phlyctema vagabunda]|uniref:Aldehyde dehydrogenase family 3 member B1 n=1 Tax=Phlyctema vagabunda TaxID=108571 RepID=A0ABR4PFI6_9HELO
MANRLDSGLATLLASVTDGRTENVRYRQNELFRLHTGLKEKSDEIRLSISQTTLSNSKDAETEFFLGMDALRLAYEELDFEKAIKDEYLVANGADNPTRRVGLGLVAIRPAEHSRFYSIISPLASAISAGNCVLLELKAAQSPLDELLSSILSALLDQETFFVSTTTLKIDDIASVNYVVDQTASTASGSSRTVALIDRSADLDQAAKSIVAARLFSNGASPYAPYLVLVNDFVSEAFRQSCFKYAKTLRADQVRGQPKNELPQYIQEAKSEGQIKTHSSVPGFTIIEIKDPSFEPLKSKLNGPYITTLTSSGLVSSVSSLRNEPTFLATYIFSSPKAAKFLSEQIASHVSYINQIPSRLLVGPASLPAHPHQLHPRYTTEMFSQPRPQVIEQVKDSEISTEIKDLRPTGQRPGHAVGFFEQGIFLGLGITAFVILPSLGYGIFRIGREAWRFALKSSA